MSKYQIPFAPGAHAEIDPAMLPIGALSSIENGRIPREGGIVKRRGTVAGDTRVNVSSSAIDAPVAGFAQFAGRDWLAAGGRVYTRGTDSGDAWQEVGRTPRYQPVRARWAQFDDTYDDTATGNPSVAFTRDLIAHVWTRNTATGGADVIVRISRVSGEAVATRVISDRYGAQVIAVGAYFVVAYIDASSATTRYARRLDTTTLALGSEITMVASDSGADAFRIATISDSAWLHIERDAPTRLIIRALMVDASLTPIADKFQTIANLALDRIVALSTDAALYVLYVDATGPIGGRCFFLVYNMAPDGVTTPTLVGSAELTAGIDNAIDIVIGVRDDITAWVLMNTYGAPTEPELHLCRLAAAGGALLIPQTLWHVRIASRPFDSTTSGASVWLRVDNSIDASANVYALCRLQVNDGVNTRLVCDVELVPDERAVTAYSEPTDVLDVGGGSRIFLGASVVRSGAAPASATHLTVPETAVGHVLYEFEDTGQARMTEAAGAGYCFGGGGQVLPSEGPVTEDNDTSIGGVEDGFFRRPAATMAVSAGAGLTLGALYQAFVVYEYIDADGRRVRSATSSLLTTTTTVGNLRLTVTTTSGLATEREASSLVHHTATHIYMTAANGAIFYRVTPDDGAPAALDRSAATVAYVQTTEPDTTKEILYTLGNVVPNAPAPAHRVGVTAAGRGWCAGLFNPRIVECSKFFVPNEPMTWTRFASFRAFAPFDVTQIDELDSAIVLLGPDGLALMSSEGPNNQGQPALAAPTLISRTGCVEPASVLRCPQGVLYQGARGINLLPRGGGEPEFLGAGLMGEIVTVLSAALVYSVTDADRLPQVLAAFAYEDADGARKVALLDPEARRWVGTDDRACGVLGTFGSLLVSDSEDGSSIVSDAETQADGAAVSTTITTGHCYPFGILGRGKLTRCQLLFTVKQLGCTLSCSMSIDGAPFGDARDIIIPAATTDGVPLTIGQLHAAEWATTSEQSSFEVTSIRFRFSDRHTLAGNGIVYHGCALEGNAAEGLRRLPPLLRSA